MEREYVISNRSKITYYIISAIFLGIALVMFFVARRDTDQTPVYIMGLVFIALPVFMLTTIAKKKVIINDYSITLTSTFTNKELQISDIKGYRITVNKSDKSVVFETKNGAGKFTLSSVTSLTDSDELLNWVQTNFTDLDAVDVQQEKDAFLENAQFGATVEEREDSLKNAKHITIAFAVGAVVIGFFTSFYDNKTWAVFDLVYPFVGPVLILTGRGLIKFLTNSKRSIYPHIFFGMLIISMVSFLRGIINGELYDAHHVWQPFILLAIALAGSIVFVNREKSIPMAAQIFLALLVSFLCGFGNVLHINKVFDDSRMQTYHVGIVEKTISRGKNTSYYLHTTTWGPENKPINASVDSRMYNEVNVGDTITIYFKPGALNIPWYEVGR